MPTDPIAPLLLSERQAAKALGVCVRTLYGLRSKNDLPHVKIGARVMYSPADLQAWIDAHRVCGLEVVA